MSMSIVRSSHVVNCTMVATHGHPTHNWQMLLLHVTSLQAIAAGIPLTNDFASTMMALQADLVMLEGSNSAVTYGAAGAVPPQSSESVRRCRGSVGS